MPAAYKELNEIQQHLEDYFKDMQDLEFTIQNGKLWMLQTRNGKRTAPQWSASRWRCSVRA